MAVYSIHDVPLLSVTAPAREAVIWEERRFVLRDRIQEKSEYFSSLLTAMAFSMADPLSDTCDVPTVEISQ